MNAGRNSCDNHSEFEIAVIDLIMQNKEFLFSKEYYLESNPAVASVGIDPFIYYSLSGWKNGELISREKGFFRKFLSAYQVQFFDQDYYLNNNEDVKNVGVEPFLHYLTVGCRQGRRPNKLSADEADKKLFRLLSLNYVNSSYYIKNYPQVQYKNINPVIHYVFKGCKDGFQPNAASECRVVEKELLELVATVNEDSGFKAVADNLQDQIVNVYAAFHKVESDFANADIIEGDMFAVFPDILKLSYDSLDRVYHLLTDDASKNIFAGVVLARMINKNEVYAYLKQITGYHQYVNPHVCPQPGDVIFDLGACDGCTSKSPLKRTSGDALVYSFEPGYTAFQNVLRNIESFEYRDRIVPVNLGSWSEKGRLYFSADDGGGSARIVNYKTEFFVDVTDIDSYVRENNIEKVSLIKMDVEGAELETLKGCYEVISKFRPRLQLSLYHNNYSDLIVLPDYLNNLNLGYKFYLGHHSTCFCETVLYATCE